MEDNGHDVSTYPLKEFHHEIEQFIENFVFDKKQWMIDIDMKDKLHQSDTSTSIENYY